MNRSVFASTKCAAEGKKEYNCGFTFKWLCRFVFSEQANQVYSILFCQRLFWAVKNKLWRCPTLYGVAVCFQNLTEECFHNLAGNNGFHRWLDKSLTIIVHANGQAGGNVEHATADATVSECAVANVRVL